MDSSEKTTRWTRFFDMCSGGSQKLDREIILIEASEDEAVRIFCCRFGRDPNNVTCQCCGSDYSITEYESLDKATEFDRDPDRTAEDYLRSGDALIVREGA